VIFLLLKSLRERFGKAAIVSGLVAAGTLGGFDSMTVSRAATHASCSQCSPPTWHVVETANFKIYCYGTSGVSPETAAACESLRNKLAARWLADAQDVWSPKCNLVLHSSDEGYLREVGAAGRSTAASTLIDRTAGRVSLRRIDVKATRPGWQEGALGHELTHVLLADRFARHALPRWVDEGVAILADTSDKQRRHRQDLDDALAARREFRLIELVTLIDYPDAQRWGTFYGQSASLVEYLVGRFGERPFLDFVEAAGKHGYERALATAYQLSTAELERQWRAHVASTSATASREPAARGPLAGQVKLLALPAVGDFTSTDAGGASLAPPRS
jgi:hypothetical protein